MPSPSPADTTDYLSPQASESPDEEQLLTAFRDAIERRDAHAVATCGRQAKLAGCQITADERSLYRSARAALACAAQLSRALDHPDNGASLPSLDLPDFSLLSHWNLLADFLPADLDLLRRRRACWPLLVDALARGDIDAVTCLYSPVLFDGWEQVTPAIADQVQQARDRVLAQREVRDALSHGDDERTCRAAEALLPADWSHLTPEEHHEIDTARVRHDHRTRLQAAIALGIPRLITQAATDALNVGISIDEAVWASIMHATYLTDALEAFRRLLALPAAPEQQVLRYAALLLAEIPYELTPADMAQIEAIGAVHTRRRLAALTSALGLSEG